MLSLVQSPDALAPLVEKLPAEVGWAVFIAGSALVALVKVLSITANLLSRRAPFGNGNNARAELDRTRFEVLERAMTQGFADVVGALDRTAERFESYALKVDRVMEEQQRSREAVRRVIEKIERVKAEP